MHFFGTTFGKDMKLIHIFSFTQLDSMKPIQLLKTYENCVYKCVGFLHENYQQQANTVA